MTFEKEGGYRITIGNSYKVSNDPKTEYAVIKGSIVENDTLYFLFDKLGYELKIDIDTLLKLNPTLAN